MKIFLIAIIAILNLTCAQAQTTELFSTIASENHVFTAYHTAAKNTASNKRLAMVTVQGPGSSLDTFHLLYSGNRGGTFDTVTKYWNWNCDEIDGASFYLGEPDVDFNAHQWYTYNPAGKVATWRREWYLIPEHDSTEYLYDSAGQLIQEIWLTMDSAGTWDYQHKIRYEYDPVGNLVNKTWLVWAGGWYFQYQYEFVFNALNELVLEQRQRYIGSGWVDFVTLHYGNDVSGNRIFWTEEFASLGGDTTKLSFQSDFNTLGQVGTRVVKNKVGDTFRKSEQYTYTYNADAMPATEMYASWDASSNSWSLQKQYVYYYETYDTTTPPPTEIAEQSEEHLKIYPVPAKEKLTIAFSSPSPTPLSFSITDMNGRLYQSWSTKQTAEYKESISMSNLPVGTYVLECSSSAGTERKKFVVEK